MGLRTGEVARRAGVHVETLRFYERKGILPEPPRRKSGYREYPPETVELVRFVKRAQQLGFSLREIRELLSLREVPEGARARVQSLVEEKLREIEHKIRHLEAMHRALRELLHACRCTGRSARCPIIESLNGCPTCRADGDQEKSLGKKGATRLP